MAVIGVRKESIALHRQKLRFFPEPSRCRSRVSCGTGQLGKIANLSLPLVTSVLLLLFPVPAMITVHQGSGWWFRGKAPGQIRALKQASAETEACSFLGMRTAARAPCKLAFGLHRVEVPCVVLVMNGFDLHFGDLWQSWHSANLTYSLHQPMAHKWKVQQYHSAAGKLPAVRDGGCHGSTESCAPLPPVAA